MEANDMKAMREALETVRDAHYVEEDNNGDVYEGFYVEADDGTGRPLICVVEEALEKPPRACDVMSQEDLTKVVISGFKKSLGIGQENKLVNQLAAAVISATIKCAYDTQLVVKKGEGEADISLDNKFHRLDECGKIEPPTSKNEGENDGSK